MRNRVELCKYFQEHYLTGLGAEIGVERGLFSLDILKEWKGKLLCVDNWEEFSDTLKEAQLNLTDDRATIIIGNSVDVAKQIEDGSLDFVYIDASHLYEDVKNDINAWLPKVRKGGVIAGHDYCHYNYPWNGLPFGVIEAVDETLGEVELTTDDIVYENVEFKSWFKKL